jgi:hypothetical protein
VIPDGDVAPCIRLHGSTEDQEKYTKRDRSLAILTGNDRRDKARHNGNDRGTTEMHQHDRSVRSERRVVDHRRLKTVLVISVPTW